ncbi:MAG: ATP-binding cassette domain-containing protein, partial [Lachnospiraceae bacterium]|nr:ATP-binding cassette domain-containing protein [Lachnospiraceae bacterium]
MEEILKVEHLHKSFEDLTVLGDVSLTVNKGEVVVIVGPSGCGKSTFLRCINGLEDIQDGRVVLDGQTINPPLQKGDNYRQRIGMVFQSYELFPHKTILGNIMLAPLKVQKRDKNEVRAEAEQLLEKV